MSLKTFPLGLIFSAPNLRLSLVACAATALVSACGGGGGGSASNTPAPSALEVTTYVALQTSAPAPVYTGVGAQGRTDVLNYINNVRQTCGLGLVRQNTALDQAAQNHGNYMVQNLTADFHYETAGQPGYTGYSPSDRAIAAGYKFNGHEVVENGNLPSFTSGTTTSAGAPVTPDMVLVDAIRLESSAPYHSMPALLGSGTDVGFGFGYKQVTLSSTSISPTGVVTSTNYLADAYGIYWEYGAGMNGAGQTPSASIGVQTYPCNGIVDAYPATFGETLAYGGGLSTDGRVFGTNPTSSPIYVIGEPNKTLVITSAVVTQMDNGADLKVYAIRTKWTDPNIMYYRNDWSGFILLDKPFAPGKNYSAVINGTSGGTAFTRSFTFMAGKYSIFQEAGAASLGLPI